MSGPLRVEILETIFQTSPALRNVAGLPGFGISWLPQHAQVNCLLQGQNGQASNFSKAALGRCQADARQRPLLCSALAIFGIHHVESIGAFNWCDHRLYYHQHAYLILLVYQLASPSSPGLVALCSSWEACALEAKEHRAPQQHLCHLLHDCWTCRRRLLHGQIVRKCIS